MRTALTLLAAVAATSCAILGGAPGLSPKSAVTRPAPLVSELTPIPQAVVLELGAADPALTLIEASDRHFKESRELDQIAAAEAAAAAENDGLPEEKSEPASIDTLLALSATIPEWPATRELEAAVESDLQTVVHDIPIPLNQKVLRYITLFQGRLRDFIQEGMTRGAKYLPMIQNVFRAEGLPLDLAYIPLVESAFKPNALSRAKAKGVWQFVRQTGLENGLQQDWYVDERSDPEKATLAAAKYLSSLSQMFDGDWHLALASYNGGPGRVQRAMKRGRQTDFWKLSAAKIRYLPRETREYVPMILAAIVIARNPRQYGFEVDAGDRFEYDTVTLSGPVDLRRIAEWTGTTIDDIRQLNPELRRWTTPARSAAYTLKVPPGTSDLVLAELAASAPDALATLNYHTVRKGETLTTIARKLGVGRVDLADANYLKATARLSVGQQLLVPRETTSLLAAWSDRSVPVSGSPRSVETAAPMLRSPSSGAELVKTSYRVRRGDTLFAIARAFDTTVAALQRWNGLAHTRIRAGERLTIYTPRTD